MKYLKTSDIAKSVGIHPNTVRLYEKWGLLPGIDRSPAGYRLFTHVHLTQVKLIRLAMKCTLFGREVKRTAYGIINSSAAERYSEAVELAVELEKMIETELSQAEEAEEFLERWAAESRQPAVLSDAAAGDAVCCDAAGSNIADGGVDANTTEVADAADAANGGFSINSAAKMLHITVDMLRDWERNGLILIPRNPDNGYRIYGPDEIDRLRVIRALRRSNYSNMSILRAMKKLESGSTAGLREVLDSPELDEDRGYLCFTDMLLTALNEAKASIGEIIRLLKDRQ